MAVIASDSFTRANETPIASPWIDAGSSTAFNLSSNAAVPSNLGNDTQAFYTGPSWPADQYSKAAITESGGGGAGVGGGVGVRYAGSGIKTYYRLVIDVSGQIQFGVFSAGSYSPLWDRSVTFVNGAVLELQVQGITFVVIYNGSTVGASTNDSTLATGAAGIAYSSANSACSIDNWEGGDFTSGSSDQLDWMRNRNELNRIMRNYDAQIING